MVPARWRPELPADRLLTEAAPDAEAVPLDVLIVGGGPAGLATAIELTRLAREAAEEGRGPGALEIGVLEKAERLGDHCLSGAVVDPRPFLELFPDVAPSELPFRMPVPGDRVYLLTRRRRLRLPTPPTMRNHGHRVASVCEIVRWMGERAEAAGVNLFTGFPAGSLLMDGGRVLGARTVPSGLDRQGRPGGGHMPATDLSAKVTVLAEGTRGALTQAWMAHEPVTSPNPQIYALGVKELWRVERPLDAVIHTLGWPLPREAFGGSWMYPMAEDLVSIGLVVGLDYPQRDLDVHERLQALKRHPLFAERLEGGELLEWGGKTIPEGGYHSLPERLHGDGLLVVGDAAGLVDVATLKGIHYAVQSGIYAARATFAALAAEDTSAAGLAPYDAMLWASYVREDLYRHRNMRLAFKEGFWRGGVKAALMQVTGGRFPGGRIGARPDAEVPRIRSGVPGGATAGPGMLAKTDAVFRAGNATRDDIPSHLVVPDDVPPEVAAFYEAMCPAGVYERQGDRLVVNPPNCIDCKATDVLGPRWTAREGGSGPTYQRM